MPNRPFQSFCVAVAAVTAISGGTVLITGCEGLDYSARSEGTGIQIVGAIVVLAKYKADAHQKAVAEAEARAAYAAAVRPVYEKRRAKVHAESQARIADTERAYARKIEAVRVVPQNDASATASAAQLHAAKEAELAKLKADEAAKIAALEAAVKPEPTRRSSARPIPSTDDLAASVPQFIAVPVPPRRVPEEQGGKATYMLYDTHRQTLASDDVFVLNRDIRNQATVDLGGVKASVARNP